MAFLISMCLTSVVGFLACHRSRYLGLTEKVFASIFIGWGYLTGVMLFFSNNFPQAGLDEKMLSLLILLSFMAALILLIITRRVFPCPNPLLKEFNYSEPQPRYYIFIPALFLILLLFSIAVDCLWYKLRGIDPIFEWDQRAELIFLEKNVSGVLGHPFYFYPLHTPLLYAWAYFFNFNNPRIFYAVALIGAIAIIIRNIRKDPKSMPGALAFSAIIIALQLYYIKLGYTEGIANLFFLLGAVYVSKYIEDRSATAMLLGSFFMTMFANMRPEGMLYAGILAVFIAGAGAIRKSFSIKDIGYYILPFLVFYVIPRSNPRSILYLGGILLFILAVFFLKKQLNLKDVGIKDIKIKHFGLIILVFFVSFYVSSWLITKTQLLAGVVLWIKLTAKCLIDIFYSWGSLNSNKPLLHYYHANNLTCATMSFFVFWEDIFFNPQKTVLHNLGTAILTMSRQFGLILWILFIPAIGAALKKRGTITKFFMLVVFPFASFMSLMVFMHIKYYYSAGAVVSAMTEPRHAVPIMLGLVYFLATNEFIKKIFARIDAKKALAYLLTLPFLYLLLSQLWRMVLIY